MDIDEAIRKLAADQHGLVSRQQLPGPGHDPNQLLHWIRRGWLLPLSPSVLRVAGAPITDRSNVMAAVLDNALARSPALLPRLHRVLPELAKRGRPGITVMRALLDDRPASSVAPASGLEARAGALFAESGFETRRQVDVGGTDWIGRVDLVVVGTNVVIEIDSALHHTSRLDRARDAERDAQLRATGRYPVRVTDVEVFHRPEEAVARVRAAVRAAAAGVLAA